MEALIFSLRVDERREERVSTESILVTLHQFHNYLIFKMPELLSVLIRISEYGINDIPVLYKSLDLIETICVDLSLNEGANLLIACIARLTTAIKQRMENNYYDEDPNVATSLNDRLVRTLCAIAYALQSKFMIYYVTVDETIQSLEISPHMEVLYKKTIKAIMYGGNLPDILNYVHHSNFKWCADETYVPV